MHNQQKPVEDWEVWEDDDIVTPIDHGEQVSIQTTAIPNSGRPSLSPKSNDTKPSPSRESRQSGTKIKRLKSRQRQKAQNAKAGIKLITDMSTFRKTHNRKASRDQQAGKFADAAALRALEGEPTSASVGNWNWLKKNKQSPTSPPVASAITPSSGGILIGIEVDTEHARRLQAEPQTATNPYLVVPENINSQKPDHQQSVWSPDTPETAYSFGSHLSPPRARAASSVYSQNTSMMGQATAAAAPPVPSMPETYKKAQGKLISIDLGNNRQSEIETPYTAFEEDEATSPLRSAKGKATAKTPESATSRAHGWWDHVVSPFVESTVAFSTRQKPPSKDSPVAAAYDKTWNPSTPVKEKEPLAPPRQPIKLAVPILREPTPRRASPALSEAGSSTTAISAPYETRVTEKPRPAPASEIRSPADYPPPYSPPHNRNDAIRYRAVFPPGHPLGSLFPPSPRPASPLNRPASPGLAGTMTSQSPYGVQPPPRAYTPTLMHDRAAGTFIPQDHAYAATGPMHRVERQRRRHEKEDYVAGRLGGFWKGRGCVPQSGCFGRAKTGREGRKKRRLCAGLCCGITLLLVLIIVLATVLTHNRASAAPPSIWVNLTDFPPMPTGVLSVLGPQNNATVSGCTEPSTLWSCSLPKEQQEANKPFRADQPNMMFQIQWDNSTSGAWKTPDGQKPVPIKRSVGLAALARSLVQSVSFTPSPKPPTFQEMWFLGETTDGIQSDQKAGEPTPFYISVLPPSFNASSSSAASKHAKRDDKAPPSILGNMTLPAPALDSDGTPSGAVMLPNPSQQPIRLFDRGLPSEHYGFYSYFQRSIFLKSVNMLNRTETEGNIPLDRDGGCRKTEANYLTTWGETRFLVKIWTRKLGSIGAALIGGNGTMPYPVSVSLDTHGGDPNRKLVWEWPMNDRQKVDFSAPELLANNMNTTGNWVNPRGMGDAKYGGFDGGNGGCRCEWVNWISGTH